MTTLRDALRTHVRPCWPKEQCATAGAAEAQKRSIIKRDLHRSNRIHVYRCPHCKHPRTGKPAWHVGHRR